MAKLTAKMGGQNMERGRLEKELPPSLVAVTTQIEFASPARKNLVDYWRATHTARKTREKLAKYQPWQRFIRPVTDDVCDAEAALTLHD